MNISDYIEKLRTKPARERERIAVIATGVAFAVIFVIWLVSFNEMNKPTELEAGPDQLEDLKNDFGSGKASIEEMFQELPSAGNGLEQNNNSINQRQTAPEENNAGSDTSENKDGAEIPQLP